MSDSRQHTPDSMPRRLSPPERLAIVYQRLEELGPTRSARAALHQLSTVLNQVEDEYSGVPRDPNPGLKFDGRMYPPREDFIHHTPDGGLEATTKGNKIYLSADGQLRIDSRRTGETVYLRAADRTDPTEHERRRGETVDMYARAAEAHGVPAEQARSAAHRLYDHQPMSLLSDPALIDHQSRSISDASRARTAADRYAHKARELDEDQRQHEGGSTAARLRERGANAEIVERAASSAAADLTHARQQMKNSSVQADGFNRAALAAKAELQRRSGLTPQQRDAEHAARPPRPQARLLTNAPGSPMQSRNLSNKAPSRGYGV
ncbi:MULTISPECIES: hypothetical protein [unclassified Streptomyces]|uniref:hypothetical protein n=1 Tax=unclassified Streptomyces TaxID=2593676 RepID=UPI00336A9720